MSKDTEKVVRKRMYNIDWMRASAVQCVVFLHCIYAADEVLEPKSVSFAEHKNYLFRYMEQCGIPIFFVMSG